MLSSRNNSTVMVVVVLAVAAPPACVQSAGFHRPPPESNMIALDGGDAKSFDFVAVEATPEGGEYADGRKARLRAGIGNLVIIVEIGAFDGAAQTIVPFGPAAITATDGPESATQYTARSGTVTVTDGDRAALGEALAVEVADVELFQVCDGTVKHIDRASISGDAVEGDFTAVLGVAGFFFTDEINTGFYDPFPYIGPADGRKFTNSNGTSLFASNTAESCNLESPRPNFHVFTIGIDPTEVPAGGGNVDLFSSLHSLVLVTEVTHGGARVRQALATSGVVHVTSDVRLEDGALLDATLAGLSFSYLDANQDFTDDPPLTIDSALVKATLGKPVL